MTDEQEWRLLKDWNPQEGDVFANKMDINDQRSFTHGTWGHGNVSQWSLSMFTLVSRANQTPRTFGELTDAEKGAMWIAKSKGKRIEILMGVGNYWRDCTDDTKFNFWDASSYRIAPTRITGTCEIDADGEPMFDTWEENQ